MQFGKVQDPSKIDFRLPAITDRTIRVLSESKDLNLQVAIGCSKWNKQELKNFYPKGTKDELSYYSSQFNSIELNATFYR